MSTTTANMVATSRGPQETMVIINGQAFILTPAAPVPMLVPILVNMAIALLDMVFSGNLSDYDTNASSFSPSVNIALCWSIISRS